MFSVVAYVSSFNFSGGPGHQINIEPESVTDGGTISAAAASFTYAALGMMHTSNTTE